MTWHEALAKLGFTGFMSWEDEMKAVQSRANPLPALHEAVLTPETFDR